MINSHHPTIKFTEEHDQQQIPFLDTIVFKEKQQIINQGLPQEDRPETIFTLQVKSSQKPKRCSPIWIIN